jgi:acetyl-CoA synthetase
MLGATALLHDGTPGLPGPDRIWDMVERHRVSVIASPDRDSRADAFGRFRRPPRPVDLRVLGSSGEPWNPGPWRWYQDLVGGGRCPIINYSGGTEISGGIVACTVITPQKPTSFSGAIPGMDADVVDEAGQSVRGTVGELIVRQPWPGITRGFWRDSERYEETYWSRCRICGFTGRALVDDDGYWYPQRSDDTSKSRQATRARGVRGSGARRGERGDRGARPTQGEHVVVFCVPRGASSDRVARPGHAR